MAGYGTKPNTPLRVSAPPSLGEETVRFLRWRKPSVCVVFASWEALEPEEGALDAEVLEELRARLTTVLTLGAEPALCLYDGRAPAWFRNRGGWGNEDDLRCYLRYAARLVRAVGHLAGFYITFYEPNVLARRERDKGGPLREALLLSHMLCDHVRAVRLIRDTRQQRQLDETKVGLVLRMEGRRRDRAEGTSLPARLTLEAVGRGVFRPPLRNALRIRPGQWTDFVGVTGPQEEAGRLACCQRAAALTGAESWIMEEE